MSTTAPERRTTARAQARFVRSAPRKVQLVVDQIRGRTVPEARTILAFLTRAAAKDVERVLTSAVANAEANHGLIGDDLYVAEAYVGGGPMLKRYRARARGRVARIRKRTCHITIVLSTPSDYEFVELPEAPAAPTEPEDEVPEAVAEEEAAPLTEEPEASFEVLADGLEPVSDPPAEEAEDAPKPPEEEPAAEATVEEPASSAVATPIPAEEETAQKPEADVEPAEVKKPKPRPKSRSRAKAPTGESAAKDEGKSAPKSRTRKKADKAEEEDEES